jgi:3-oxoacyl-[acyl-carrier-protein] synthase II
VKVHITGIGWVTTTGMGCAKDHHDFVMTDGELPHITPGSVFDKPYPPLRRMDDYSRLGLAAIAYALKDAGLSEWKEKRNIGIIASTACGCLSTDIEYFRTVMPLRGMHASPALFSYTLPNTFLGEAAIRFGLTGTSFIINTQAPLDTACFQMALECIASGEADKMLCGLCNSGYPSPFKTILEVPPGALFFMIEKSPWKGSSYGRVGPAKSGHLEFKGIRVKRLDSLVTQCLSDRFQRKKTGVRSL